MSTVLSLPFMKNAGKLQNFLTEVGKRRKYHVLPRYDPDEKVAFIKLLKWGAVKTGGEV